MNKHTHEMLSRLERAGIEREDAYALRRIAMTLHRWHELECGDGNDSASWCIERDETTGKAYWLNSYTMRRYPVADREKGAETRLIVVVRERHQLVGAVGFQLQALAGQLRRVAVGIEQNLIPGQLHAIARGQHRHLRDARHVDDPGCRAHARTSWTVGCHADAASLRQGHQRAAQPRVNERHAAAWTPRKPRPGPRPR